MDKDSIKSRVKRETMMMLILGIGAWIVLLIFLSCKSLTSGEKDTYEFLSDSEVLSLLSDKYDQEFQIINTINLDELLKDSEIKLKVHGNGLLHGYMWQLTPINDLEYTFFVMDYEAAGPPSPIPFSSGSKYSKAIDNFLVEKVKDDFKTVALEYGLLFDEVKNYMIDEERWEENYQLGILPFANPPIENIKFDIHVTDENKQEIADSFFSCLNGLAEQRYTYSDKVGIVNYIHVTGNDGWEYVDLPYKGNELFDTKEKLIEFLKSITIDEKEYLERLPDPFIDFVDRFELYSDFFKQIGADAKIETNSYGYTRLKLILSTGEIVYFDRKTNYEKISELSIEKEKPYTDSDGTVLRATLRIQDSIYQSESTKENLCSVYLALYDGEKIKYGRGTPFELPYFDKFVRDTVNHYSEEEVRDFERYIKIFTAAEMEGTYRRMQILKEQMLQEFDDRLQLIK
jgi:hypothetical protein